MARFMLPIYASLPDPAAPDPADLTDFQNWAALNLPDLESALDAAGNSLVEAGGGIDAAGAAMDALGLDLASAFDTLGSYAAEEDADTFEAEIAAAAAQDAALEQLVSDLGAVSAGMPIDVIIAPLSGTPLPFG